MSTLLIRGGRVIDPAQRLDAACDILIRDGLIAEIAAHIDVADAEIVDRPARVRPATS